MFQLSPELESKVWDVDVEKAKTPVSQASGESAPCDAMRKQEVHS